MNKLDWKLGCIVLIALYSELIKDITWPDGSLVFRILQLKDETNNR